MKIIVTCGPSYEPIEQARRMTNFSTGKLGVTLANFLADAGHEVFCLKGEGSTFNGPVRAPWVETFATNDDPAQHLESIGRLESEITLHWDHRRTPHRAHAHVSANKFLAANIMVFMKQRP